jgi:iron complex transport system substrate-binding protein
LSPLYRDGYIETSQETRMLGRSILALLLLWSTAAAAADVVDATGRKVQLPDHIAHVLPAGPPAAVLLEALAPDLMVGWPSPLSEAARAVIAGPASMAPEIPRLTGKDDVTDKIKALKPDLILDYGSVSQHYTDLAKATQDKTGIPTILLDGSLTETAHALRTLGGILHREDRAETLARLAEAILALPLPAGPAPKVLYARGDDGLNVAAPGTDVVQVFNSLGWQVVAPAGEGTFRRTTIEGVRALAPDVVIFSDPRMQNVIAHSEAWQTIPAVHEGRAFISPSLPFGWVEDPPSINRLLARAWLSGADPGTLAALFNAVVYGHVLTPAQYDAVLAGFQPLQP